MSSDFYMIWIAPVLHSNLNDSSFSLAFVFTCLCSAWVNLEVWDAGNLPGKACLQSFCRPGLSARSDGHWEHFQAGFQHQKVTDWQHQGIFGFICFGVERHHLKAILSTNVLLNCGQGKLMPTFFSWFPPVGGSMLISAVCCFFLFFGNSESAMIGWQCLFCGASIAAWNALDVITVELYPTDKRCSEHFSFYPPPSDFGFSVPDGKVNTHARYMCMGEVLEFYFHQSLRAR